MRWLVGWFVLSIVIFVGCGGFHLVVDFFRDWWLGRKWRKIAESRERAHDAFCQALHEVELTDELMRRGIRQMAAQDRRRNRPQLRVVE